MQIRIKDLSQKEIKVPAESSTLISQLKLEVEKALGVGPEEQKLIYSGKVLSDDQTVEQAGITETGFVVMMKSKKPKAVSKPETPASAPVVETPTPAAPTTSTPAVAQEETTESASATLDDPSALVTGSEYEKAVTNFLEMGFEKEQISQAMRAAFNNPVRAAEYLLGGIPDDLVAELAAPAAPTVTPARSQQAPVNPASQPELGDNLFQAAAQQAAARQQSTGSWADSDLTALRQSPQFQMIRQAIQDNPALLQPILSSLGASNPQLLQQISANPEAFLQLLNESEDESAGATLGSEDGGDLAAPPGQQYIQVSPEENEAIARLEALGFERNLVIQAYFACDKDEQVTANYLFDHGHED